MLIFGGIYNYPAIYEEYLEKVSIAKFRKCYFNFLKYNLKKKKLT